MNEKLKLLQQEAGKTVIGNETGISGIFTAILAGGHILIESAPGTGKTTLSTTTAKAMGLDSSRISITEDTPESDILGVVVRDRDSGKIKYRKGAVYTNVFIAEGMERAPANIVSIITDIMADGKLVVGSKAIPLPDPFAVIATVEKESGVPSGLTLEERDRFMAGISLNYLRSKDNVKVIKRGIGEAEAEPADITVPVMTAEEVREMRREADAVSVPDAVLRYISSIAEASRKHHAVSQGITPRGTMDIASMARARAYIMGKGEASFDDVKAVLGMTISHRLGIIPQARAFGENEETVTADLIAKVKAPKQEAKGGKRE